MGRVLLGYVFFLIIGSLFGYVLAVAYLNTQLQQPVGLLYPLLNAQNLAAALPEIFERAVIFLGVCAFAGLAIGVYLVSERLTTFGTTHWLTHQELRQGKFFNKPGLGFLVAKTSKPNRKGKFISSEKFPHCLVIAPTGRGKGTGFVIPNLLTTKGSAVVLDVKGENFEKTARHRKSIGDKIIRFAPTDFTGSSHRYNPLLRIYALENESEQMFELQKLATLFLQSDNTANEGLLRGGMDAFVAGVLTAFERKKPTMGEAYRIINGGEGEFAESFRKYASETGRQDVRLLWEGLAKITEKTLSGYISMLNTSGLAPWKNPHVDAITSDTDIDFFDLRKSPHSVYFTIRTQDIESMAGLIRLFFSDLIACLEHHEPTKDEPWPVMIVLDEFHKLGKMPIVAESITTLRSYGGRLAIITQTIPKLDEIYGRNERLSLEGGAGLKIFMTPSEEMTAESLSDACGKTTKRVVSKSRQSGFTKTVNVAERTEEVPLLTIDAARRLALDDIIVVVDGGHPIRAKAIKYYEDPFLKRLYEAQSGPLPVYSSYAKMPPLETARPVVASDAQVADDNAKQEKAECNAEVAEATLGAAIPVAASGSAGHQQPTIDSLVAAAEALSERVAASVEQVEDPNSRSGIAEVHSEVPPTRMARKRVKTADAMTMVVTRPLADNEGAAD